MYPKWFWLLLLLLPYLAYEIFYKDRKKVRLRFSRVDLIKDVAIHNSWLRFFPVILRSFVLILLVVSLARPRIANKKTQITGKGIDIILAIDVSGSMQAVDFKPVNRLEAAKKVATEFIQNRKNDRIGLVTFSDVAFTQCPLTLDYNILMTLLNKIKIDKDAKGTAIGMGLATSVARLKDSKAKSKVIILITDGRNNSGEIDPFTAAELAETYNIKVYTIGVGSKGPVDFPMQTPYGIQYRKVNIDIDMGTLNKIAQMTGTKRARRATNTQELKMIMKHIDKMEKTEIKIKNYYRYEELFQKFLIAALILLLLEFSLRIVFRYEKP